MYGHVPVIINNEVKSMIEENLKISINRRIHEYLPAKIAQIKAELWEDNITNILQNGEIKISKWDISVIGLNPILIDEVLKETYLTYDKSSEDISELIAYASTFYKELREGKYIQNKIREEIRIDQLELEIDDEKVEAKKLFSKVWMISPEEDIIKDFVNMINPYKILTDSLEKLVMGNEDSTYLIKQGYLGIIASPIISILNEYFNVNNRNELKYKDNEFISASISYVKENMLVNNSHTPENVKNIATDLLENSLYYLNNKYSSIWLNNLINRLIELNINKKIICLKSERTF